MPTQHPVSLTSQNFSPLVLGGTETEFSIDMISASQSTDLLEIWPILSHSPQRRRTPIGSAAGSCNSCEPAMHSGVLSSSGFCFFD